MDANIGRRIGPYEIVREIGAGGVGSVYLAQRVDEFRQRVAIKLLRAGMDSRMVISRFRHERQILAGLHHPNISRLLDGGATEDGRPYFVMEYVEGKPIDAYANERGLSIRERLQLFRQICAAVQYAHQNLVVHRDIKPGNILVTEDGTPKLLDFGIAKLQRPVPGHDAAAQEPSVAAAGGATLALTEADMRLMTPEFASPEQARGLPITTASDVYSLGVVLYQLLTGRMPYQFKTRSPVEVELVISEQEPPRPSTVGGILAKGLTGDLDNLVLKALEKDTQRRYGSAEQLSEDIRRYLEGMPVLARPQTLFYRAGKFARRNRMAVAAAILLFVSLTGGLVATSWEAQVARQQRARAERRFNDVRRLTESFLFEFHDKIKDLTGATEARRLVVAKALEYLDGLEREASGDRSLQLELAEAYGRLGDVQGNPYSSNIGDAAGALQSYDKALRLAQAVIRSDPRNAAALRTAARAWRQRGDVLPLVGKARDAAASARQAVQGFHALVNAYPPDLNYRTDLAESLDALGDVLGHPALSELEDTAGAAQAYRQSLEIWESVLARDPQQSRAHRAAAVGTMKLGDLELDVERLSAAENLYSKALKFADGSDLSNPENLRVVAVLRRKLAYIVSYRDVPAALKLYRAAAAQNERLVAADPKNARAHYDFAVVLKETGELQANSDARGAVETYRRVLDQLATVQAADPENPRVQQMIAEIHMRISGLLMETNDREQAGRMSARGLELGRQLAERPDATPAAYSFYAEALLRAEPPELRNPTEALRYARLASNATQGTNPSDLDLMAEASFQAGQAKEAIALEEKALGLLPRESAGRAQLERHLARFRAGTGKH